MSKTILIVEDDRSVAQSYAEVLEEEGFTVTCQKNGEWGWKTFLKRDIDLIILDVLIPVMNGFELAERIRKHPKGGKVPIIMVSGIYKSQEHRSQAISKYGVLEYLDKPVRLEELRELLRRTFEHDYPSREAAAAERRALEDRPAEDFADARSREELKEVERESHEAFRGAGVARGDMTRTPFPQLLAELYRWRSTGALLLKHERIKKILYLRDGYPISVKSNVLGECLGKLMVKEKMITPEECEESLKLMKSSGRQQGTVLMEMGCISPHNLVYALEQQLVIKLFDLFSWRDGDYLFNPRSEPPATTVTLDLSPADLIYEGIRRGYSDEEALAALEDFNELCPALSSDPLMRLQDLNLEEEGKALVQQIDGRRTLSEIYQLELLEPADCARLIFALQASQMIDFHDHPIDKATTEQEPMPLMEPEPEPSPPRIPSPEETELKDQLREQAEKMKQLTHFQVLGVGVDASAKEIQQAYFALAKQYHPDKHYRTASAEIRDLASEIFDTISRAYEVLSDEGQREQYQRELREGVKAEVSDEVSRIIAAESHFKRGEELLKKRQYEKAHQRFQEAVYLYPDEGEFHAYLGWSLFKSKPGDSKAVNIARDHLEKGIALNPRVDRAYLFLGWIFKHQNRQNLAEQNFEKAIECNPDCTEALRELRLISMRREKQRGGLLGRRR